MTHRCRSHIWPVSGATVSFNLTSGASLEAVTGAVRRAEKAIGLPAGFQTFFREVWPRSNSSLSNELFLVIAAV